MSSGPQASFIREHNTTISGRGKKPTCQRVSLSGLAMKTGESLDRNNMPIFCVLFAPNMYKEGCVPICCLWWLCQIKIHCLKHQNSAVDQNFPHQPFGPYPNSVIYAIKYKQPCQSDECVLFQLVTGNHNYFAQDFKLFPYLPALKYHYSFLKYMDLKRRKNHRY